MIYAIGDIHGQIALLEQALERIEADGDQDAQVVFLGDVTDRGPASREVLDLLITCQEANPGWIFIKGNHDRMLHWYLEPTPKHDLRLRLGLNWLDPRLGGDKTLASYGVEVREGRSQRDIHKDARDAVPRRHVEFLEGMQLSYQTQDLLFVHAGIRPNIPLRKQREEDLLWIRDEFLNHTQPHEALVIHGHTIVDSPTHYGNRVNLDGGAAKGREIMPAVFEGKDVFVLTSRGREKINTDIK
ncbi:metallophosphoesterase [Pelagovum sp. HNIBRBA483]|uniref:metallophosphoesterase n=1 Tax=Pelagovum sp. HNIBRBA483 TaxID=3233341 RepID=UPI0034A3C77A